MKYLLVRHAQTDANRLTRAAFGKQGAPINQPGMQQSAKLGEELRKRGFDTGLPIAVSELLRTQQTAEVAGFRNIKVNELLNEVNTSYPAKAQQLIAQHKLPREAKITAKALLANPPIEEIWVTHGLVIAAVLEELGLSDHIKFIPDFCEIREIQF